ncbi:MAG: hypothetical protein VB042_02850 [Victivallaceae bacterium]|nr:hypothetical protein [Victivallaceae bacterium]
MADNGIDKIEGCYWGYAYLHPHTEKKLEQKLISGGVRCYLPVTPRARMHHNTRVVTDIPMIPSYIFLCVSLAEASELRKRERQIVKIALQTDANYEETLISELRALRQCEALAKEAEVLVNPDIREGDKVLITAGPLKGLVTDVVRRGNHQGAVIVNLTMLQQHIEYSVAAETLEKITT